MTNYDMSTPRADISLEDALNLLTMANVTWERSTVRGNPCVKLYNPGRPGYYLAEFVGQHGIQIDDRQKATGVLDTWTKYRRQFQPQQ